MITPEQRNGCLLNTVTKEMEKNKMSIFIYTELTIQEDANDDSVPDADEATWSESRVTLQGRANETAASRVPAR